MNWEEFVCARASLFFLFRLFFFEYNKTRITTGIQSHTLHDRLRHRPYSPPVKDSLAL